MLSPPVLGILLSAADEPPVRGQNVLFIAIDDLRTEVGCYGSARVKTPNLDTFASSAVLFSRAYCQASICTPSRTSVLTGCRPDTTRVFLLNDKFREALPDVVTLPQHFKAAGYRTVSLGKVFHWPDPISWSEPEFSPKTGRYADEVNIAPGTNGPAVERADVPDNAYRDGAVADRAIEALGRLKGEPFFLAVGFHKPHLPFAAPTRYWDLYSPETLPLASRTTMPENAPLFAQHSWAELRAFEGIPKEGPVSAAVARELVHGYLASVSYVDAQVGRLLNALETLDLADDTIVVIWGDNGFYLGDLGLWCKMGTYEDALRVPLLVRAPGVSEPGARCARLVELLDLYPTLCDLARLPMPEHLEGESFKRLLSQPDAPFKAVAFGQQINPVAGLMGYTARDEGWRYTSWRPVDGGRTEVGAELYAYEDAETESRNLIGQWAHQERVTQMRTLIRQQVRASRQRTTAEAELAVRRKPKKPSRSPQKSDR